MSINLSAFGVNALTKARNTYQHSQIDRLTYAIGDIHGRQDLFANLLHTIQVDAEDIGEKPRIVLLGDYIDRGPASSLVLQTLVELKKASWCDVEILLGNHEFFLVNFMIDCASGEPWIEHGGLTTLSSYGLKPPRDRSDPAEWDALLKKMLHVIPRAHLRVFYEAKIYFRAGDYLFVHAGVKPGVPLEDQKPHTMLWIRGEFLEAERASEFVVVHGHSAKNHAENLPWRIGVDTGAYANNVLTAVRLLGRDREIMQVRQPGTR